MTHQPGEPAWRTWARIALPSTISVLLFIVAVYVIILPSVQLMLYRQRRQMTRELARSATSMVAHFHSLHQQGKMTRDQAQQAALAELRHLRYGPGGNDYFWVNNMAGDMLMHPYMSELEGTNMMDYRDPAGKRLVAAFVRTVRQSGSGFVEYTWQLRDDPNLVGAKLSYVEGFEPWGWIIGTGMYMDEVRGKVQAFVRRLSLVSLAIVAAVTVLIWYTARQALVARREQGEAEQALRESAEWHRALVEGAGDAIALIEGGRINYVNPAGLGMLGYEQDDLLGRSLKDILPETPLGRPLVYRRYWERLAGRELPTSYEAQVLTRDGEVRDVQVSATKLNLEGRIAVLALLRDITDRKQAEQDRQRMADRLRQAEKMEAVGKLAGGIAHDFNNILTAVIGNAELLRMEDPADRDHLVDQVIRAASRASELTRQLLAFARKGKVEIAPVDLGRVIDDVVELLVHSIDRKVTIQREHRTDATVVMGDRTQLQNALLNLGLNARDAMPKGGTLSFELDTVVLDSEYCQARPYDIQPGPYLRVTVRDTGVGMSDQTRERVFEPFFTTKDVGQGTGLGLASVYGCVKNHGGSIEVESRPGEGSAFQLFLPASRYPAEDETPLQEPSVPAGQGKVMVVDDEEIVRDLTRTILQRIGYEVTVCSDGREAIEVFSERHEELDLVILDLVMPHLSGHEVLAELRRIDPDVCVLLISGYSTERAKQDIEGEGVDYLAKPFSVEQLCRAVDRQLHAG